MPEKLPAETNEYEQRVLAEMDRLRERREQLLHSPLTGEAFVLPPSTEKGLRQVAEENVQSKIREVGKKQEKEKIKEYIKAEGLTEAELEEIAKKRLRNK